MFPRSATETLEVPASIQLQSFQAMVPGRELLAQITIEKVHMIIKFARLVAEVGTIVEQLNVPGISLGLNRVDFQVFGHRTSSYARGINPRSWV